MISKINFQLNIGSSLIKKIIILIFLILLNIGCTEKENNYIINFSNNLSTQKYLLNTEELSKVESFSRPNLKKIRENYLLTGISDNNISVNLILPKGKYKLTAYLEAGLTDSTFLQLLANEIPIKFVWQSFSPPAEGRDNIQKMYRSINIDVSLKKDSLTLDYIGVQDSIRLLALYIFPIEKEFYNVDSELNDELKNIGNVYSDLGSEEIRNLKSESELSNNNSFSEYLKLRLEEFALAIDLFNMIGWEKGNEIYGLGIFDRLNQSVMLLDGIISDPWIENYFGERARLMRGKILWWLNKERGGKEELACAMNDLKYLNKLHPENKIIRMYLGQKIDLPDKIDSLTFPNNAPEWSKLQYESLLRLTDEIDWWVNERQAENGELGGKIGDDVELLRWWSALAAYGDKTTIKGWKKLGEAVWNNPKVFKGYSAKPIDVEHSSEFIADAFPEMIYFNNAEAEKYLKPSAEYFRNLWTFKNKYGKRFFKSAWFSSTEVKTDQPRNRDLAMNSRAVKAVRFLAWENNDPELLQALNEWSISWKDLALRKDKGKPVGLFPASVRGTDEQFNGDGENWYDAEMFWTYFNWESDGSVKFYDQLLFSYITNKDDSLLEPIKLTLRLINNYGNTKGNLIKGSKEWAAKIILNNNKFWNTVIQYRIFTGDKSYDNLIIKYGNPYSKYLITKNDKFLIEGLELLLNDIRYNTPLRTTEVIHTDRVRTRDIITLKGMITGNDAYESDSPFLAVTYENTNDVTMLVSENSLNNLEIKFYSYSDKIVNPIVKVWLLENGIYNKSVKDNSGNLIMNSEIEIIKRGQEIKLEIPSNKKVTFSLIKK